MGVSDLRPHNLGFTWRTFVVLEFWAVPPLSPTEGPRGRNSKDQKVPPTFLKIICVYKTM